MDAKREHTPEPWVAEMQAHAHGGNLGWQIRQVGGRGGRVAWVNRAYADTNEGLPADHPENEANAARIVACVNACRDVSTENLHPGDLHGMILDLGDLGDLRRQRDELAAVLHPALEELRNYRCDVTEYEAPENVQALDACIERVAAALVLTPTAAPPSAPAKE